MSEYSYSNYRSSPERSMVAPEQVDQRISRLKQDLRALYRGLVTNQNEVKAEALAAKLTRLNMKFSEILAQSKAIADSQKQDLEEAHLEFRAAVERYQNSRNLNQNPQERDSILT